MTLDNDTRGWIMTCISGIACVLGSSVICIDIIVRPIPRMRNFSITESDAFLSASLSLSFGVMLFSSLYSMLPQSKSYLQNGGYSPAAASYFLIALFLAGVIGIRALSAVMHRFMPTHVVDCDHTHDEETLVPGQEEMSEHAHDDEHTRGIAIQQQSLSEEDEETPLLSRTTSISPPTPRQSSAPALVPTIHSQGNGIATAPASRRPSMVPRNLTRTLTRYMSGEKQNCDESGPCMGFSKPCGQDCFKAIHRRGSILTASYQPFQRTPTWRKPSADAHPISPLPESEEGLGNGNVSPEHTDLYKHRSMSAGQIPKSGTRSRSATHHYHHPENEHFDFRKQAQESSVKSQSVGPEHHHHVPTNAFMSIGLQTSLAIALHKAPEGFITYATNHANPTLGFAVFMALFIHNITEGFAMSLPLYLALGSRIKAILWSSLLGGFSQPIGAGVAALWFKLANGTKLGAPSEGVYGGMFALTAGVMTSVALSLFSESLQLSHNRGTCIVFAFLGMGILGVSFALTAK